ncbi:uncharacterized protein LOC129312732 isoform X1 [Prosopis cineraria]|uniref:uncharacterized protein LOC129312732 isoform X1 n=1 Tax=Prosopis cineraria TaxID=364024 RepID=UPI00241042A8|nr:uncharacterized protein LOC129312732 isoform X1 [Prosopis cineraria]XP_054811390.1 uncharacterized protein LOC129312732 isoform X1 [Prosopis cineraria]
MTEDKATHQPTPQKQMWSEQKQAAVHEEISRMNQLPAKSTYVAHRMRVLNKILQLISIQRTAEQEREWSCSLLGCLYRRICLGIWPPV